MPAPPVMADSVDTADSGLAQGQFFVADVYQGLGPFVKRGSIRYLRICEEVRAGLIQLAHGEFQADYEPFEDWYASPTHKVRGPYGWPSYVAKSDLGLVPVEEDGSANFNAPAGKVLYFQALDADLNEIQRMRSVVQLQAGEKRGCVGCHDNRLTSTPSIRPMPQAIRREPSTPISPPWGAGPFAYEKVVQSVWNTKCIQCHDAKDKQQINLTAVVDSDGVPASYRTLIEKGYVHYFDFAWGREHNKAEPLTFGAVQSKLFKILDAGHYDIRLTREENHRVKCWIDLNCPLWPDYIFRPNRSSVQAANRSMK
jgi:cytochrome c553